jgi:hypothetical protein
MPYNSFEDIICLDTQVQRTLLHQGTPLERIWAAWALGLKLGSSCAPSLITATQESLSPDVRCHFIVILAGAGERSILETLAIHDPDEDVRDTACLYLIQAMPHDQALQSFLIERLTVDQSQVVRHHIIQAAENGFPVIDVDQLERLKYELLNEFPTYVEDVDNADLRYYLSPALRAKLKHYKFVGEGCHRITEENGKQELTISGAAEVPALRCDRIIRLTFAHYLSIEQGVCYLYTYTRHGMKLLAELHIEGTVTLSKVMLSFARTNPDEYAELSKSLYKEAAGDRYISYYRCFDEQIEFDISVIVATVRVMIDNNFNKTYLDIVGSFTGKSD